MSTIIDEATNIIWRACDVLRGHQDSTLNMEYVLAMFFIRYVSGKAQKKLKLSRERDFWSLYKRSSESENAKRIDETLLELEALNPDIEGVFKGVKFDSTKLGNEKARDAVLREFIKCYAHVEILDDQGMAESVFQNLLDKFASDITNKTQTFSTPKSVANLLVCLLQPSTGNSIYDPTCGTGGLLLSCAKWIKEKEKTQDYKLYGQEKNGLKWAIAKMNMAIHCQFSEVALGDTLEHPSFHRGSKLTSFDVVLAHLPFFPEKWPYDIFVSDQYKRDRWGAPPKGKADYAFISHALSSMDECKGRCALIVTHGVLFRAGAEQEIRKRIIQENLLDAVIGLPPRLFPGTTMPTAILIFKKKKSHRNILFIDASKSFEADKNQNQLKEEDILHVQEAYAERTEKKGYSRLIDLSEIETNGFSLNLSQYIHDSEERDEIDLDRLQEELLSTESELKLLKLKLENLLRRATSSNKSKD
tara:strand:- start:296548 stop:297969 length:1422 start_codon:yes stop_codon:yes gene_type:complete